MPTYSHTTFAILLPMLAFRERLYIDAGSGIVASLDAWRAPSADDGRVLVHYEGARFCPMTYGERVMHAASRQATNYGTIAKGLYLREQFLHVGDYDLAADRLSIEPTALFDLAAWGVSASDVELETVRGMTVREAARVRVDVRRAKKRS
jgi:hypothetical protein